MSRYVQHQRYPHQELGSVEADSSRYITVPGYIGSTGNVEVSGKIPMWMLVAGGLAAAWYFGVSLPLVGKRKK